MSRENQNVRQRVPRVEKIKYPSCGHKHMWGSRSQTGGGFYAYKCTKCGFMVK